MSILSLKKRKEFVNIAKNGQKAVAKGLVLQAFKNTQKTDDDLHIGFTATKKVGNAVQRNRVKRKLRAVISYLMPNCADISYDYVIIGRRATLDRTFDELIKDLKYTLHSTGTHK